MFETLTEKFSSVFSKLRGYGVVNEKNIEDALREVRLALLEADVHVAVVKSFLEKTKERALGQEVLGSLKASEQFFKVVHEELTKTLGGSTSPLLDLGGKPPHVFLMVGLQGSGKTTTTAKLAHFLKKQGRRPYLIPADVRRPAAIDQLKILARSIGIPCWDTKENDRPVDLVKKGIKESADHFSDLILIDTAGRLHLDEPLMQELKEMQEGASGVLANGSDPRTLLVVDAMLGQGALATAKAFHDLLKIDGVILTKLDGDARGGAALSVASVAGCPVYFTGVGEKIDDLEVFDPPRLVSRLLDRGDILSLVEKASAVIDQSQVIDLGKKLVKNALTLEDFLTQLRQMKKIGSFSSLLSFLPGGAQMAKKVNLENVEKDLAKKEAIINSMTVKERKNPEILNGSRRLRIAKGSGTEVSDVNRLLKEFGEMKKMMKNFNKGGNIWQSLFV